MRRVTVVSTALSKASSTRRAQRRRAQHRRAQRRRAQCNNNLKKAHNNAINTVQTPCDVLIVPSLVTQRT